MNYDIYTSAGESAGTVLLSAGLGGAGGFWAPQIDALRTHFDVIVYDQRGTGRNAEALPTPYSIADMAADVRIVLDDAGVDACHFVGHALGGLIGLELAATAPERVASLCLVNAWLRVDSQTRRCFDMRLELLNKSGVEAYVRAQPIFLYPATWLSANTERLAHDDAHGVAHFQGPDNLRRRIGALLAFDAAEALPAITTPTLVAAARDDILVPWTASQILADNLPNAEFWLTPEGGHGFSVVDPAIFNDRLLAFLDSIA